MELSRRGLLAALAAALTTLFLLLSLLLPSSSAHAATSSLCDSQTASVAGGGYIVQNNEYDSTASECVTTDGNADFSVANSSVDNGTGGSPAAYPSIYQGCHWGACSTGGLSSDPIQVSALSPGEVTTSWSTTQPGGANAYDVAYDIWFNQTATTASQPNCTEIMVWLNHDGSVQPFGSTVASGVNVGGTTYNIWEGAQSSWDTVTYDMTTPATSVSDLDLYPIARDAVSRGYLSASCYLIDVEAGFELWQGGAGLATNSFSVNVGGSVTSTSPSPTPTPTPTSGGGGGGGGSAACTAAYTVTDSWSGGYQGQVTVTAGSSALTGWQVAWTYPATETIDNLWNGAYTQSGQGVDVTNASYDGSLAAGSSTEFGFTATDNGSDAPPATLDCTATG
jgi:cellulose 1,4-beta-cellobiosidase